MVRTIFCGLLALLSVSVWAGDLQKPGVIRLAAEMPERVLFVGNSYFYYNDSLHNHVRRLLAELKPEIKTEFKSATIGGARLAGVTAARCLLFGANTPWKRVRLTRGLGTNAAKRAMKSSGSHIEQLMFVLYPNQRYAHRDTEYGRCGHHNARQGARGIDRDVDVNEVHVCRFHEAGTKGGGAAIHGAGAYCRHWAHGAAGGAGSAFWP